MRTYQSQAAEEKKAVATTSGAVEAIVVTNLSAATKYLFAFDNASAASGTRLAPAVEVPPGQPVTLDATDFPIEFTNGLYLASSNTQSSYTASTTADFDFHVDYSVKGEVTRRKELGMKRAV